MSQAQLLEAKVKMRWIPSRNPLNRDPAPGTGVAVDELTADLARRVAAELGTRILLRPRGRDTALYLLGPDGQPLRNHHGGKQADKHGRPIAPGRPIIVAIVGDTGGNPPVSVYLEPVPGSSVGYAGDRQDTIDEAVTHITRHYRPALYPDAEPWQWDTPWKDSPKTSRRA